MYRSTCNHMLFTHPIGCIHKICAPYYGVPFVKFWYMPVAFSFLWCQFLCLVFGYAALWFHFSCLMFKTSFVWFQFLCLIFQFWFVVFQFLCLAYKELCSLGCFSFLLCQFTFLLCQFSFLFFQVLCFLFQFSYLLCLFLSNKKHFYNKLEFQGRILLWAPGSHDPPFIANPKR